MRMFTATPSRSPLSDFWIQPCPNQHRLALVAGKYFLLFKVYELKFLPPRSCPGTHFAKASLFINITTILATFDIRPVQDKDGQEVLPVVEMIQGVTVTYELVISRQWTFHSP